MKENTSCPSFNPANPDLDNFLDVQDEGRHPAHPFILQIVIQMLFIPKSHKIQIQTNEKIVYMIYTSVLNNIAKHISLDKEETAYFSSLLTTRK